MDRERILTNQTVVVKNGVIVEIGDAKKVKLPKDAVRIDGTGKYLVPGLFDMHTHLLSDSDEFPDSIGPHELRVMVANGVTTVRFMIGTPELLALRNRSANGEIEAPTIFVASPHLTGKEQGNNFVVNTSEEAREAVRKSKAAGYDFIKVTTFISRKFTKRQWTKPRSKTYALSVTRTVGPSASNVRGKRNSRSSISMVTWNSCFVPVHL